MTKDEAFRVHALDAAIKVCITAAACRGETSPVDGGVVISPEAVVEAAAVFEDYLRRGKPLQLVDASNGGATPSRRSWLSVVR